MLPLFLTTLERHSGIEEKTIRPFSYVILPHSLTQGVKQHEVFVAAFFASKLFSYSLLGTGQSSTHGLFSLSPLGNVCRIVLFMSCWKMHGCHWKRGNLECSICFSKILVYFPALVIPSEWYLYFTVYQY